MVNGDTRRAVRCIEMAGRNGLPLLALSTESLSVTFTRDDSEGGAGPDKVPAPTIPKYPPSYPLRRPAIHDIVFDITTGQNGYTYDYTKFEKSRLTFDEGRFMWETNCIFSSVGPLPPEGRPSVSIRSQWTKFAYTGQRGLVEYEFYCRELHRVTTSFINRAPYDELVQLAQNPDSFKLEEDTGRNAVLPTNEGSYNRFWKIYTPYGQRGRPAPAKYPSENPLPKQQIDRCLSFLQYLYYINREHASPMVLLTPRIGVRISTNHVLEGVQDLKKGLRRDGQQNRPALELQKRHKIDGTWEEAWLTLWASQNDLAPTLFCCSYNFGYTTYIMEAGIDFREYVRDPSLVNYRAVQVGSSLLALIQKGARKGLVMADCKPGNLTIVVRGGTPQVRFIDFGSDFATVVKITDIGSAAELEQRQRYTGQVDGRCAELLTLVVLCAGVYSAWNSMSKAEALVYKLCADRLRMLHKEIEAAGEKPDGVPYTLCGLLNELTYDQGKNLVQSADEFGRGWRMFLKTNPQDVASTFLAMAKWYGGIDETAKKANPIIKDSELKQDKPLLPQIINAIQKNQQQAQDQGRR
jgi:hypothetical protein